MIKAFDIARSTIAAIDQAETGLAARTFALRASLDEIMAWSKANGVQLGDVAVPALDAAERDPLAALGGLAAAEAAVAALKVRRDDVEREIAALDKALNDAAAALEGLRAAVAEAKTAIDDAAKRFEGVSLALDPAVERAPVELETWLATLSATRAAGGPRRESSGWPSGESSSPPKLRQRARSSRRRIGSRRRNTISPAAFAPCAQKVRRSPRKDV